MANSRALSLNELRAEIRKLNRMNADAADYNAVKKIYDRMLFQIRVAVGTTSGGELFFRGRVNPPNKPKHISEMGAPVAERVTGYQRCNAPHQPLFYCSSRRITALLECRVKPGDNVCLGQWIGQDRLPVNKVLDTQEGIESADSLTDLECVFYAHLDTVFTRRIHYTFSNDYIFSAAASEVLTSNFAPGEFNIRDDGRIGIRYPSIFDLKSSYNTAFPPKFALERIELLHLMELRVDACEANEITASVLDTAVEFDDGAIHWTGNNTCLPAPRRQDGSVMFIRKGEKWRLATTADLTMPQAQSETLLKSLLTE